MIARLIKSTDAVRLAPVLAPLDLQDVQDEARRVIEAASHVAAGIIARARVSAAKLEAEARAAKDKITQNTTGIAQEAAAAARQRGYDEGLAAGRDEGRSRGLEQALAEARERFAGQAGESAAVLGRLTEEWTAQRRRWYVDIRQDVVALAIAIARRIAPRLGELNADIAVDACAAALEQIGRTNGLTIRVHPQDLAALRQFAQDALGATHDAAGVRWIEDESMLRGGVQLESSHGTIDAAVMTQVDRIADELFAGWRTRMNAV